MSRRLGVGLIGAGVVGQMRAETVRGDPGTDLVVVADADLARAEEAARGSEASATSDAREVVERASVDLLVISTPVHLHEETVLAGLAAGKDVLCEKPLAPTVDACRRMVEAARSAGRHLAVGFNHRYYPPFKDLARILADGEVGPVDHLRVFGGHLGLPEFRADWMYQSVLSGGGAMMDLGLHVTDLVRFLVGEIVEVHGVATNRIWKVAGSEDNAVVVMKTRAGALVSYQSTWSEWRGYRLWVEAYGPLGMVRAQYAPMARLQVAQEAPGGRRRRRLALYPYLNIREKLLGWKVTARNAFAEELRDFRRRIEGESVPLATGVDGLRAVEIAREVGDGSRLDAAEEPAG